MAVKLTNHNLVDFQAKWLTVCQGLKELVAEGIRRDLLYKQIKDEPPLKFDIDQYLRAEAAGQTTGSLFFLDRVPRVVVGGSHCQGTGSKEG